MHRRFAPAKKEPGGLRPAAIVSDEYTKRLAQF
jgi:hypothetical protein